MALPFSTSASDTQRASDIINKHKAETPVAEPKPAAPKPATSASAPRFGNISLGNPSAALQHEMKRDLPVSGATRAHKESLEDTVRMARERQETPIWRRIITTPLRPAADAARVLKAMNTAWEDILPENSGYIKGGGKHLNDKLDSFIRFVAPGESTHSLGGLEARDSRTNPIHMLTNNVVAPFVDAAVHVPADMAGAMEGVLERIGWLDHNSTATSDLLNNVADKLTPDYDRYTLGTGVGALAAGDEQLAAKVAAQKASYLSGMLWGAWRGLGSKSAKVAAKAPGAAPSGGKFIGAIKGIPAKVKAVPSLIKNIPQTAKAAPGAIKQVVQAAPGAVKQAVQAAPGAIKQGTVNAGKWVGNKIVHPKIPQTNPEGATIAQKVFNTVDRGVAKAYGGATNAVEAGLRKLPWEQPANIWHKAATTFGRVQPITTGRVVGTAKTAGKIATGATVYPFAVPLITSPQSVLYQTLLPGDVGQNYAAVNNSPIVKGMLSAGDTLTDNKALLKWQKLMNKYVTFPLLGQAFDSELAGRQFADAGSVVLKNRPDIGPRISNLVDRTKEAVKNPSPTAVGNVADAWDEFSKGMSPAFVDYWKKFYDWQQRAKVRRGMRDLKKQIDEVEVPQIPFPTFEPAPDFVHGFGKEISNDKLTNENIDVLWNSGKIISMMNNARRVAAIIAAHKNSQQQP